MTPSEVRELLKAERRRIERDAEASKDSQSAVFALMTLYTGLGEEERHTANEVLVEWALSDDPKRRFDGLALIDEFLISSAVPALRELAQRFRLADEPSSPYDLAKVQRILARLGSSGAAPFP